MSLDNRYDPQLHRILFGGTVVHIQDIGNSEKIRALPEQERISEILRGNRSITADTALRLSKYFGNSPNFWLGLQNDFDIEEELLLKGSSLKLIKRYSSN